MAGLPRTGEWAYFQVKGAAADPAHPVQALLARLASQESRAERCLRERLRSKQRGR